MMQGPRRSRNIGMKGAVGAIVLALAVCGALPASAETHDGGTGNMVFFKGGFVVMNSSRSGEIFTDAQNVTGAGTNDGRNGWYAGAGLDLVMTKDTWGAMSKTWVLGEIGLQFNRLNSNRVVSPPAAGLAGGALDGGASNITKVELTMMTINVSPKIKFMEDSAFRPWLIPVGLDFHVISPPSNQTQYLDIGLQFGAGFEYRIWKAFNIGMDARYHLTANMTNTNNSYFQVGPYVGIAF
jgi:hypothetical protein